MRSRWHIRWSWFLIRDILLTCGGLGGVAHETFSHGPDRPDLLVLYAGMMGLPAFLQADTRRSERDAKKLEPGDGPQ